MIFEKKISHSKRIFHEVIFTENLIGVKKDDERIRRTAEREGRRIRRLKTRSIAVVGSHIEGMSSDDEITEMAAASYRSQKGKLRKRNLRLPQIICNFYILFQKSSNRTLVAFLTMSSKNSFPSMTY